MKLTIPAPELTAALTFAAGLCPARPITPITAAVLLSATDADQLQIRSTDLERFADLTTAADVATPGQAAVSGRLLAEVAKHCRGEVTLTLDNAVTVSTERGWWTLPTLPAEDIPPMPELGHRLGRIRGAALAAALARVAPVAGADRDLPVLGAVHVHADTQRVRLEATDRYQAAWCDTHWAADLTDPVDLYLPADAAPHLQAVASAADTAEVTLTATDGTFALTGARHTFRCRLAAEPIPDLTTFDRPADTYTTEIRLPAKDLRDAVGAVRLVLDQFAPAKLTITPDVLSVDTAHVHDQAAAHHLPVLAHRGAPELAIGLNPARLLHAVTLCGTDQVTIAATTAGTQVLIRGVADGAPVTDYRHIVMPQRLPDQPTPAVQR